MIDPQRNAEVDAHIKYAAAEDGKLHFTATITKGETVFFKCKGVVEDVQP